MPMSLRAKLPKRSESPFSHHPSKRIITKEAVVGLRPITSGDSEKTSLGNVEVNGSRARDDCSTGGDAKMISQPSRRLAPKPDARSTITSSISPSLTSRKEIKSNNTGSKRKPPNQQKALQNGAWPISKHKDSHQDTFPAALDTNNGFGMHAMGAWAENGHGAPAMTIPITLPSTSPVEPPIFQKGTAGIPALRSNPVPDRLVDKFQNGDSRHLVKDVFPHQKHLQREFMSQPRSRDPPRSANPRPKSNGKQYALPYTHTFRIVPGSTEAIAHVGPSAQSNVNSSANTNRNFDYPEAESLLTESDSSDSTSHAHTPASKARNHSIKVKHDETERAALTGESFHSMQPATSMQILHGDDSPSKLICALQNAAAVLAEMSQGGGRYETPYAQCLENQKYPPHPVALNKYASLFVKPNSQAYVTPYANPLSSPSTAESTAESRPADPDQPQSAQATSRQDTPKINDDSTRPSIEIDPKSTSVGGDGGAGIETAVFPLTEAAIDDLLALAGGGSSLSAGTSESSDDDDRTIARSMTPEDKTDPAVESVMEGIIAELTTNLNHGHGLGFLAPHISYHQSAHRQRFATELQTCVVEAAPVVNVIMSKEQSQATSALYKQLVTRITPPAGYYYNGQAYGNHYGHMQYGRWIPQPATSYQGSQGHRPSTNFYYPPPPTLASHQFDPPPIQHILPSQPDPTHTPHQSQSTGIPSTHTAPPAKFRSSTAQGRQLDRAYGFPRLGAKRAGQKRKRKV